MQERQRHGLIIAIAQLLDCGSETVPIQRRHDGAIGCDAFVDLEDVTALDEGRWLVEMHVVRVIALLAPDDQNVAEPRRRYQRCS